MMNNPVHYSIKDLEKLSGIKAHTLRIWEKRYGIINPTRTDTNIRFYTNDDLKRILNISFLNHNGIKISRIAGMTDGEIELKVAEISLVSTDTDHNIENLIISMIDLDEARFNKIFTDSILRIGFENALQDVIFPFIKRTGVMWLSGTINPAQEHFISNIIRQKLIVAIDGARIPENPEKTALLFLPQDELHEISLLFYNFSLRSRGIKTIYLGQSVPLQDLLRIIEITNPDFIVTIVTHEIAFPDFAALVKELSTFVSNKKVLISGKSAIEYKKKLPSNFFLFKDLNSLLKLV
jgi:MerR family transcriptional regulator, light-induced transcriptional regulator